MQGTQEKQQAVRTEAEALTREFASSAAFSQLGQADRENCEMIAVAFTDFMYSAHAEKPGGWTAGSLEDVLCELFPRKLTAEADFFESVEPSLCAYIDFLSGKGIVGNAALLKRRVHSCVPDMMINVTDPASWDFAKRFANAAMECGVDIDNEEALTRFMGLYSAMRDKGASTASSAKVARNQPCPCKSGKKYKQCCGRK